MDRLRKPYGELERVKNNHPHPKIDPAYPKTTDGTTAAQVRQVPRRAVQQVPYGNAKVKSDGALSCLANFILTDEIIPNSDTQDTVLAKIWKGIEDIQTYGSTDAIIFYKTEGDYFGTDWRIPYKRDIYLESGRGTFSECNIIFVRSYYQKTDLQAIVSREEGLAKSAKERGETYKSTWVLPEIKKLIEEGVSETKDAKEQSDTETDKNIEIKAFKFVHGYQKGKKAKFFTYCESSKTFVREFPNNDPRGVMPVKRIYYENDLANPEGRGIVELVAPLQNYLDSTLQAWQYTQAYNIDPAITKRGNFKSSQIRLKPSAIIDLGQDPNARIDAFTIDSSSVTSFSNTYGLVKSQILNLFGGDDQSVSATVGNPGFSKTDAGVNARQAIVGINDNFIRKRVEAWLGEIFCSQLNIYFAVTQGDRNFYPSKKDIAKLAKYGETEYYTIEEEKLIVHFSAITDKAFEFVTEASTSKAPDTSESKEQLLEAVKSLNETGLIGQVDPRGLARRILMQSNVDDIDELLPNPEEQQGAEGDLPPEQVYQNLLQAGYPEELAQLGAQLESQGYKPEQVEQVLNAKMQEMKGQQA